MSETPPMPVDEATSGASRAKEAQFQVGPDTHVTLRYRVLDGDGEPVEEQVQEVSLLFGCGQMLAAVEQGLAGSVVGARLNLKVPSRDAFGPRDPSAVVEIDRDEFPSDVAAGDRFEAEREDGNVLVLQILEVAEDHVVMDTNHPLAGQDLTFELEVLAVRPATDQELEAAAKSLLEGHEPVESGFVPASSLLKGRNGR
jgi:FKBP-type peptidyl-prolyl cis-trans isomerase SlyD